MLGAAFAVSLTGACQGPGGPTDFVYGGAAQCARVDFVEPMALQDSLGPLQQAFDRHADVPRMVVLMPHVGCERGAEILRREVLDAHPDADLRLFIIWQDLVRNARPEAAERASRFLDDERVISFYDCEGLAGRAFATGNLPVAEARELFLFYPAGLTWPKAGAQPTSARVAMPPRTERWVHQLGRVAPERFCTAEELPRAIRVTMDRLLEEAAIRNEGLEEAARAQGGGTAVADSAPDYR